MNVAAKEFVADMNAADIITVLPRSSPCSHSVKE